MCNREMMDAVVFKEIGKWEFKQVAIPKITKPDEVLIKVEAASICGTDIGILATPPGYPAKEGVVLGHEFVGEILEAGEDVTTFAVGDRVFMDNNVPCGICPMCKLGKINLCQNVNSLGIGSDGFFAQYAVAPQKCLIKISKEVPSHIAAIAEPVMCVMGGISRAKLVPGETAVVVGGGTSGIIFAALYQAAGAKKVILVQRSKKRAEMARKCGIHHVISPLDVNVYEEIMKETNGLGADVVTDAVGNQLDAAIQYARPDGRIILYGMNSKAELKIHPYEITKKGVQIIGSLVGSLECLQAASVVESGIINHTLENMVTHKFKLSDFGKAYEVMLNREAIKVVLYPF